MHGYDVHEVFYLNFEIQDWGLWKCMETYTFFVVQGYKHCIWCVLQWSRKSKNKKNHFCYIIFVELVEDLYYVYYNKIHKKKPVYFHHFCFIGKSKFKTKRHVKANSKQKKMRKPQQRNQFGYFSHLSISHVTLYH